MNALRGFLLLLAAGAALLAPAAAQARSAPIATFENIAISAADGRKLTLDQVKRAIIQAAATRQWAPSVQNANTVRATYTKGKHSAVVDVAFTETSYSIHYVDSTNLGYADQGGKAVIHPAYNKAVTALRQGIEAALRTIN
jgi:hypothetical protein